MDNNQNYGQPMNDVQQNYGQQMYYNQEQYGQPQQMQGYGYQQPYDQGWQQYPNMQQPYDQQYFAQQQMNYNQQQMNYNQQQMYYNQANYVNQPQTYTGEAAPKKKFVINKKIVIIAAILVVVVLAVIFIPKLFNKVKPPFKDVELGLTAKETVEKYNIDEKNAHSMDAYKNDVEGFGVEGDMQFCFFNDTLFMVNWYVYEHQCGEEDMEKAFDVALEYYTDKYGKPEIEEDETYFDCKYSWEYEGETELELEVDDDYFVIRIVNFDLMSN
ncbi:MAG: hypothetical protein IKL53_04255 [Lachnospiraceae bacterium]|nr:hypothetical protein [Lachnospiraceae bacterium]